MGQHSGRADLELNWFLLRAAWPVQMPVGALLFCCYKKAPRGVHEFMMSA